MVVLTNGGIGVDLDYVQGVNILSTIQCMHSPGLHGGWLLWSSKASVIGVRPYLVWISFCPHLYRVNNWRKHIVPLVAMDMAKEIEEDFLKFDFYLILFCIFFIILVVP